MHNNLSYRVTLHTDVGNSMKNILNCINGYATAPLQESKEEKSEYPMVEEKMKLFLEDCFLIM